AAWRRPPTAKDNSDEALIAKIASGNRLAMQVLFARHHARIYRFVLRLIGSEALAEDITSEVFLDVWRQARRFEARSAVTTWLVGNARLQAVGGAPASVRGVGRRNRRRQRSGGRSGSALRDQASGRNFAQLPHPPVAAASRDHRPRLLP